ncbi:MAG: hypothetical protein D6677_03030 [Calditrichaeota bacterium]|nr:MAG: hypothetical protein D6677_03030 [Calditrichota bacterium]
MIVLIGHLVLSLMYGLNAWLYWSYFYNNTPRLEKRVIFWLRAVITAHLLYMGLFTFRYGRIPIAASPEALGTFVIILAFIYATFEYRFRERSIGAFLMPLFSLLMFISAFMPHHPGSIQPILFDVSFEVHVLLVLMGYSGFTLSFISSVLFLILNHQITKRKPGLFFRRLPSLQFFERMSALSINGGILFLMLGVMAGSYFGFQVWSRSFLKDPKILSVLIAWCLYLVHFILRKSFTISDRTLSVLSVIFYLFLVSAYILGMTLFSSIHNFN